MKLIDLFEKKTYDDEYGEIYVNPLSSELTNILKNAYIYDWKKYADMLDMSDMDFNSEDDREELHCRMIDNGIHGQLHEVGVVLRGCLTTKNMYIIDAMDNDHMELQQYVADVGDDWLTNISIGHDGVISLSEQQPSKFFNHPIISRLRAKGWKVGSYYNDIVEAKKKKKKSKSLSTMGGVNPDGTHSNAIKGDVRQPKNKGVSANPGFVGG